MLRISASDLIERDTVEGERIEYKKTLNDVTIMSVVHTVCAFANDLFNLNGGYLVIGVEEQAGRPKKVVGIPAEFADKWQRDLLEKCRNTIRPAYVPRISVEKVNGAEVLVATAYPGQERPYRARKKREGEESCAYVRIGSATLQATDAQLRQLYEVASQTPFDEQTTPNAHVEDLDEGLLRSYVQRIGGDASDERSVIDLAESLDMLVPGNGARVPRNAALLMFCRKPSRFLPGAKTEVAILSDEGGSRVREWVLDGPLDDQITGALHILESEAIPTLLTKEETASRHIRAYPVRALQEAIANAVVHRDYKLRDPVLVKILPDHIDVISFPGPTRPVSPEHIKKRSIRVPARNRQLHDLLRGVGLVERLGTGLRKIDQELQANGSSMPAYEITESSWSVVLPIHPALRPAIPAPVVDISETGLIMIAIGPRSIRDRVLAAAEAGARDRVVLDFEEPKLLEAADFPVVAKRLRNALRSAAEDARFKQLDLYYNGPVAFGPLIGAILARSKPVLVRQFQIDLGSDILAYQMDQRFLLGRDD